MSTLVLRVAATVLATFALIAGQAPPAAAAVSLRLVAFMGGLASPVEITNAHDGSGRLFVVEQAGRIRIVSRGGSLVATPFLDIRSRVACCGERGLLGVAFHPAYRKNGRFYVSYTDATGALVVAEYRRSATSSSRASTTERRLLRIPHPTYANHNGGQLAFGPDGYLYIGTGDGGGGGDPSGNSQRRSTLLGKILRIAPNVTSASPAYRVPASNPWATSTTIRHEIWAYGLRNPWRFSFDRRTGDLWVGDVGQDRFEEIDRARRSAGGGRGANYGWSRYEADTCFRGSCTPAGITFPIASYGHDAGNGCAVVGGAVYRGSRSPALAGLYLFGDYCSGRIWTLSAGGAARQRPILVADTSLAISAFGEDEAGELYVADYASGRIYHLVGG